MPKKPVDEGQDLSVRTEGLEAVSNVLTFPVPPAAPEDRGGYLAVAKCGCAVGWQRDLRETHELEQVRTWLRAGCNVRQLADGEDLASDLCEEHGGTADRER